MINIFKLMNSRSIYSTLWARCINCVIFNITIILYGLYLNYCYKINDIGLVAGLIILVSYLVLLICITISIESVMKDADPLSIYNRKKYAVILSMEFMQIIVTYFVIMSENRSVVVAFLFSVLNLIVMYFAININKSIIDTYNSMSDNEILSLIHNFSSSNSTEKKIDTVPLYKNFFRFTFYIILLYFIYKVSLNNWLTTVIFSLLNCVVIVYLFLEGSKKLVKHYILYLAGVCFISTLGIVLMKLIYDGVIDLSIFKGRDEQEYLMCLVLFYLPITIYGKRLFKVNAKYTTKWSK